MATKVTMIWPRWLDVRPRGGAIVDGIGVVRPALWLLAGLLVSAVYLFGAALVPAPSSLNLPEPLYPPEAIVIAVLLLTPPRRWWVFLLEAYLFEVAVYLWMGYPLLPTVAGHAANVVEPLVGALLVRRFSLLPPRFDTLREFSIYSACVTMASVTGATLGAASLLLTGRPYWPTWQAWFLGDVLANLLLAPMILLWVQSGWRGTLTASRWRLCEAAVLFAALMVASAAVFGTMARNSDTAPALINLLVPLLLWSAVRFGPRGIASALCLVTIFAIPGVTHGMGPVVTASAVANIMRLQLFLLSIGIPLFFLATLVRERRRGQVTLEQSEERYRAVVSNFPNGAVLLFGADLRHIVADGRGLPEMHLDRASIEGKTPSEAFPPELAAALVPHYQATLSGEHAAFDLEHHGRIYQTQVLPLPSSGVATGMVVMQDVTDHRNVEGLTALNQAKTAFFNNVSHELRTPLTLLMGPLQELLASAPERFSAEVRERLEISHRSGVRLLKLVNTLLDLSRLEAGRFKAVYVPTDLAEYTAGIASTFRGAIEQAGLRLVVHCPRLPEPVYVDRDQWEHIVVNLLSNALKFTPSGEIVVTLGADGEHVVLTVRDTGVGIDADEVPHLFERFYQAREPRGRVLEGTGIGLALVRELANLHAGTVGVTSVLGQGSTFTVAVPRGTAHLPSDQIGTATDPHDNALAASRMTDVPGLLADRHSAIVTGDPVDDSADPVRTAVSDASGGRSGARPARLLVAEDHPDLQAYMARLLEGRGVVDVVGDGLAALESARARKPDLILADVMMPGLDGFALLEAVRADPHLRSVSVILLSASAGDDVRTRGLRAGADDYLIKPFTVAELLARVDGQLWLARMRNEAWTADERERIAFDLHDSATQSVYGVTLLAEAARRATSRGDQAQVDEYLGTLGETAQRALRELRLLVSQLRPASLADLGLVRALQHRLDAVERRAGLTARMVVTGEVTLTRAAEEAFYFIAQEALNNALKHAGANDVIVRIVARPDRTNLVVADDGHGFDLSEVAGQGGLGLVSMRERAERIGASLTIGHSLGGGTRVIVRLGHARRAEPPARAHGAEPASQAERAWPSRSVS